MDEYLAILSEVKRIISNCLCDSDYESAFTLVKSFYNLGIEPDLEMREIIAELSDDLGLYGVREYLKTDVASHRLRVIMCYCFPPLDLFTDVFKMTFELLGHQVYVVNFSDVNTYYGMIDFVQEGVDLFFSFNNAAAYIKTPENVPLISVLPCKIINFFVDHPMFTIDEVYNLYNTQRTYLYVPDLEQEEYLRQRFDSLCHIGFMPHGGIEQKEKRCDSPKLLKDRQIDVLYVGATKGCQYPENELCLSLINQFIEKTEKSSHECVISHFANSLGMTYNEVIQKIGWKSIDDICRYELIAVEYYRVKAVQYLVENGIKVQVYGDGWDKVSFCDNPNLLIGGIITPEKCLELMNDSKIVLNIMPWFKKGTHERIFNAMLSNAICLTDESSWINDNLVNEKEIITFKLDEIEKIADMVKSILMGIEDETLCDSYQAIADSGYENAKRHHTWSHRAISILSNIEK